MSKKSNSIVNLFKGALGLPTSDCCTVTVPTTLQPDSCCNGTSATRAQGSNAAGEKG